MSFSEIADDNRNEVQRASINLRHVHIFASDINASLNFYTKWFGARVIWDGIFAGARNVFVQIGGGGRLHFYDQKPLGEGKNTFHHLGIQVDDLDELYTEFHEKPESIARPLNCQVGIFRLRRAESGVSSGDPRAWLSRHPRLWCNRPQNNRG